jgi:hypothetical protein
MMNSCSGRPPTNVVRRADVHVEEIVEVQQTQETTLLYYYRQRVRAAK